MPVSLATVVKSPTTGRDMGAFRASLITGLTTGMSANAPIASLRWTDASHQCLILGVTAAAAVTTAFGTAQSVDIEGIIARSFTVSDSSGTAITIGTGQKFWRDQADSLVADLRVAGAGALTAGTRTLDATGMLNGVIQQTNALGSGANIPPDVVAPLAVLSANEGLILRVPTAQGATGVVKYYLTVVWKEVPNGMWM